MRTRNRSADPTARARSGHAACGAAFCYGGWSRHASRPPLPCSVCGRVFRARRAVGAGRRVQRCRLVCGRGARSDAVWSSHAGCAHRANKVVASLRICCPSGFASGLRSLRSLRGSRGCPQQIRIEAPLYPTPPAHPSFRQQSRQWALAALMLAGRAAHHDFRCDRGRPRPPIVTILAGHSGPPLHRPLRGLGGAAVVRRAHDAPCGIGHGFRDRCTLSAPSKCERRLHARKVSRRRQATGRAKRRCAPRFAGFPFGTSDGVGPSIGMAFGPRDRRRAGGHRWPPSFLTKGGQRCHATPNTSS